MPGFHIKACVDVVGADVEAVASIGGADFGADRRGILSAGIVVGDDRHVGHAAGDLAHDRALALVAVAAAAEHQAQLAARIGPERAERLQWGAAAGVVMRVDTSTGWVSGIRHCPSPNYNQRPHGEVSLLVIHNISLPPGQFGTGKVQAFFGNQLVADKMLEALDSK